MRKKGVLPTSIIRRSESLSLLPFRTVCSQPASLIINLTKWMPTSGLFKIFCALHMDCVEWAALPPTWHM